MIIYVEFIKSRGTIKAGVEGVLSQQQFNETTNNKEDNNNQDGKKMMEMAGDDPNVSTASGGAAGSGDSSWAKLQSHPITSVRCSTET